MIKLGPITYGDTEEAVFLGREITTAKNYSENTAKEIDKEIKYFVKEAYSTAIALIKKHKRAIQAVAEELVQKEVLEQEEFYALITKHGLKSAKF